MSPRTPWSTRFIRRTSSRTSWTSISIVIANDSLIKLPISEAYREAWRKWTESYRIGVRDRSTSWGLTTILSTNWNNRRKSRRRRNRWWNGFKISIWRSLMIGSFRTHYKFSSLINYNYKNTIISAVLHRIPRILPRHLDRFYRAKGILQKWRDLARWQANWYV